MTTDKRKISYKTPTPGLVIIRSSHSSPIPITPSFPTAYYFFFTWKSPHTKPGTRNQAHPPFPTSQQERHPSNLTLKQRKQQQQPTPPSPNSPHSR